MTIYYVAYRDVEGHEPRKSFELMIPPPAGSTVVEQTVPSLYGHRTIYIQWHRRQFGEDMLHLATYTQTQLNPNEVGDLAQQAIKFAQVQRK
jgi:hypothetical protein